MPPALTHAKRVSFLVTTLTVGGAETQVRDLALGLHRRGWDVQVIPMREPDAYVGELGAAGIRVQSLRMRSRVPTPIDYFQLARALRDFRPSVLHSHMYRANILGRSVRTLARVPVAISTAHNIWEGGSRSDRRGLTEIVYRVTEPWCDLTTNVSRTAVERYVRTGAASRDRIRYVPNGLDTSAYRPDPEVRRAMRAELGVGDDELLLLAAGRLHAQKDYPSLLAAFAALRESQTQARLLIAGEGAERPLLERLLEERQLQGHAQLLGLRSDVPRLLNAADVFVMSSRWEGLPMVLLEAAATAVPIVTTDVGGTTEIVADGVNGLIVPAGQPALLADALRHIASMPAAERIGMGEAGRSKVETEYDIEHVLDLWEALYAELLARHTRGRTGHGAA